MSFEPLFEAALPWIKAVNAGGEIEVDVVQLDTKSKKVTIRHRLSYIELNEPDYVSDQKGLMGKSNIEEFSGVTDLPVVDLVELLFDWAKLTPFIDTDAYEQQFEGEKDIAQEYDPPRTDEESGLGSYESWLDSEWLDKDEGLYARNLETGERGFTFSLSLNERGQQILDLLGP